MNPFLQPSGPVRSSGPSCSLSNASSEGAQDPLRSSGGSGAAFQTQLHPDAPKGAFSMLMLEPLPFLPPQCSYLARIPVVLGLFILTKVGYGRLYTAFPTYSAVWGRGTQQI